MTKPKRQRKKKKPKDEDNANMAVIVPSSQEPQAEPTEPEKEEGGIQYEDRLHESETTDGSLTFHFSPTEHLDKDFPEILHTIYRTAVALQHPETSDDHPETITFHTGIHDMTTLSDIARRAIEAVSRLPLIGKYLATSTTNAWTEPLQVNFTRHHKGGFVDENGIEDADWTEVHETTINKKGVSRANIVKVINQNVSNGGRITKDAILVEVFSVDGKVLTLQVDERGFVYE